ncbi:MAG: helix-turn-helix domain-containing protein [Candidatus Helarchaeota archaeon]|nr:helix-turn-helix domain-containing protein [Candidatus Helarchaeota archaeon]
MTLQELADSAGLYKSNISDIENEKRFKPNIRTLERLARALNCEVGDFFERSIEKEEEITKGLKELLEDERLLTLLKITDEEIEWMKSVRFRSNRNPTKETYIDMLYTYRKIESKGN